MAAARLAGARRPDLSRSVAEAAALETALRAGPQRRRARAHPAAGRQVPLRHRYRRLCGVDARPADTLARLRLERRARRRLAAAVAGLCRDTLPGQGRSRGPGALLPE